MRGGDKNTIARKATLLAGRQRGRIIINDQPFHTRSELTVGHDAYLLESKPCKGDYPRGTFFKVKQAWTLDGKEQKAIKIFQKPLDKQAKATLSAMTAKEEQYYQFLYGQSVKLAYREKAGKNKTSNKAYVILPYLGTDLFDLATSVAIDIESRIKILDAVISDVMSLWKNNAVHIDLKRENITYDPYKCTTYLIDLSSVVKVGQRIESWQAYTAENLSVKTLSELDKCKQNKLPLTKELSWQLVRESLAVLVGDLFLPKFHPTKLFYDKSQANYIFPKDKAILQLLKRFIVKGSSFTIEGLAEELKKFHSPKKEGSRVVLDSENFERANPLHHSSMLQEPIAQLPRATSKQEMNQSSAEAHSSESIKQVSPLHQVGLFPISRSLGKQQRTPPLKTPSGKACCTIM